MKAIVENKLSPVTSTKACAFAEIIVVVTDSRDETELRKGMIAEKIHELEMKLKERGREI